MINLCSFGLKINARTLQKMVISHIQCYGLFKKCIPIRISSFSRCNHRSGAISTPIAANAERFSGLRTTVRNKFLLSPVQLKYPELNGVLDNQGPDFRLRSNTPPFNTPSIFCSDNLLYGQLIPRRGVPSPAQESTVRTTRRSPTARRIGRQPGMPFCFLTLFWIKQNTCLSSLKPTTNRKTPMRPKRKEKRSSKHGNSRPIQSGLNPPGQ